MTTTAGLSTSRAARIVSEKPEPSHRDATPGERDRCSTAYIGAEEGPAIRRVPPPSRNTRPSMLRGVRVVFLVRLVTGRRGLLRLLGRRAPPLSVFFATATVGATGLRRVTTRGFFLAAHMTLKSKRGTWRPVCAACGVDARSRAVWSRASAPRDLSEKRRSTVRTPAGVVWTAAAAAKACAVPDISFRNYAYVNNLHGIFLTPSEAVCSTPAGAFDGMETTAGTPQVDVPAVRRHPRHGGGGHGGRRHADTRLSVPEVRRTVGRAGRPGPVGGCRPRVTPLRSGDRRLSTRRSRTTRHRAPPSGGQPRDTRAGILRVGAQGARPTLMRA